MTELEDAIAAYAEGFHNDRVRLLRVANAIVAEARKPDPAVAEGEREPDAWLTELREWCVKRCGAESDLSKQATNGNEPKEALRAHIAATTLSMVTRKIDRLMERQWRQAQARKPAPQPQAALKQVCNDCGDYGHTNCGGDRGKPAPCPACHGTGEVTDRHDPLRDTHPSKMERCEACDGFGVVEKQAPPSAVQPFKANREDEPPRTGLKWLVWMLGRLWEKGITHLSVGDIQLANEIVQQLATAPPSDAAKAWRERMSHAVTLFGIEPPGDGAAVKHGVVMRLADEAVALITAEERRANAWAAACGSANADVVKAERERDTAQAEAQRAKATAEDRSLTIEAMGKVRERLNVERDTIQREVERSHRILNELVQRERAAVKRAEAAEKKLHGAEVRAEAAEFNFQSHVKSTLEARTERDDLRARLDKLLAACQAYGLGGDGVTWMKAIAEARSGATDAPQAQEGT